MRSRSILPLLAILALSACVGQTPAQQYFELKQHYDTLIHFAASYRTTCDTKPVTDVCKGIVTKLQGLDAAAALAFAKADEAMTAAEPDATYQQIVYQNAKVALSNLETYVTKIQ